MKTVVNDSDTYIALGEIISCKEIRGDYPREMTSTMIIQMILDAVKVSEMSIA